MTVPSLIFFLYQSVTPTMPYLSTGLAGCLVDPGISCGAYKLTRTPRVIKKKKKVSVELYKYGIKSHGQNGLFR